MLLPLGVKILWFVLSLTGLAGCWIFSLALGRTIGSLWAPILYCVGCSILQGIFCIGMVWKMNPFAMPGQFCTAQSIFISLGMFVMTGVICTLSYMTNRFVHKPKSWADRRNSAFTWKHAYALPIVGFPLAALAVHLALILKLRAVRPALEFYCDSSSPQWIRILSYTGTPLLLSLPSLFLSIQSVLRVQETNQHIQRVRSSEVDMDPRDDPHAQPLRSLAFKHSPLEYGEDNQVKSQLTDTSTTSVVFTPTPFRQRKDKRSSISDTTVATATAAYAQGGAALATSVHFDVPVKPLSSETERGQEPSIASLPGEDSDIPSTPPPAMLTVYSAPNNPDSNSTIAEVFRQLPSSSDSQFHLVPVSLGHARRLDTDLAVSSRSEDKKKSDSWISGVKEGVNRDSAVEWHHDDSGYSDTKAEDEGESGGDEDTLSGESKGKVLPKQRTHSKNFSHDDVLPATFKSKRPPLPYLSPAVWRIILFQITFVFFQVLCSLSTVVDVARHSIPTPLGTHHFAILFAAWGPILFFGFLPSVRQNTGFRLRTHPIP